MFNPKIQSFISSSGESVAKARVSQIYAKVDGLSGVSPALDPENVQSFSQTLEETRSQGVFDIKKVDPPPFYKIGTFGDLSSNATLSTKEQFKEYATKVASRYGVDDKLVHAVIQQESGFNSKAKSHVGAVGLMQLMPATAKEMGVSDVYNPKENIEGGVKYLSKMLKEFNGNKILALADYNAGPNAVKKYNAVPPYKETQNYVRTILANYLT